MKRSIPFLLIGWLMFSTSTFAQQQETFDLATFQPPKGWQKQASADSVQFSIEDKTTGGFCLISLFKSVQGLPSSKENFDAAWQLLVKEAIGVSSDPQIEPPSNKAGWDIVTGFAPFEKDGAKAMAILVTASGYGKMVNMLVLTNTDAFQKNIAAFLDSVSLKKPVVVEAPPQTPVASNGQPSLVGNHWKQGAIRGGMLGHSGLSTGTFAKTYQFFSNGTYKFYREDMQLAAPKYYLENEEGTYTVSGNTITITPRKATYSQHRLSKEEPPIKSGNLALSTAQYRFEFWRYDDNWRLLLSPVDGNETKRDGTFSFYRNGEPQRTYQYHLVDSTGKLMQ